MPWRPGFILNKIFEICSTRFSMDSRIKLEMKTGVNSLISSLRLYENVSQSITKSEFPHPQSGEIKIGKVLYRVEYLRVRVRVGEGGPTPVGVHTEPGHIQHHNQKTRCYLRHGNRGILSSGGSRMGRDNRRVVACFIVKSVTRIQIGSFEHCMSYFTTFEYFYLSYLINTYRRFPTFLSNDQ